ncbi:MAG: hypothetical protein ACFHVJ_10880 [Aestuariibacter sp.]
MTTQNTTPQSATPARGKGREPDYDVFQEMGDGRNTRLHNIGAVWKSNRSESLIGETVHTQRIVLIPRASKEDLDALRDNKQQKEQPQQDKGISH